MAAGRQSWLAYISREMPDTTTLFSAVSTSKALSDTEEKIEVAGLPHVRVGSLGRGGVVVKDGIDRRIEVIAQVSAYRANGCAPALMLRFFSTKIISWRQSLLPVL